jgi:ATP-dependent DNA helicase RecQ
MSQSIMTEPIMSETKLTHLKNIYGFNGFRDFQEDVINDILEKKDTIVIFPTGGGKSLCYQFPATFSGKKTIVVSPLISLMTDQQLNLSQKGIRSMCLNGEKKSGDTKDANTIQNSSIIYCTPEYLTKNCLFFKRFEKDIGLFAIDEAHCLSEWGHDFRPSYKGISIIRKTFKDIPIMALTATATPNVLEDIFTTLGLEEIAQYQLSSFRPNLSLSVKYKSPDLLYDIKVEARLDESVSTIIYCPTRKEVEKIFECLKKDSEHPELYGIYHGGLSSEEKHTSHTKFVKDELKILIATICFGMGVDKPDIRKVINYGSPSNIETYYQELGRAGRDGMESETILFSGKSDYITNSFLINKSNSETEKKTKNELLAIFHQFIENQTVCRQFMIESYFENGNLNCIFNTPENVCLKCDNCLTTKNEDVKSNTNSLVNAIEEARIIVRTVKSLQIKTGIQKIIKTIKTEYDEDNTIEWWKNLINLLILKRHLQKRITGIYTVIDVGDISLPSELMFDTGSKHKISKVLIELKKIREKLARMNNIAPYMVINDKVLELIVMRKPKTVLELSQIDGVCNEFIFQYGKEFFPEIFKSVKPLVSKPSVNSSTKPLVNSSTKPSDKPTGKTQDESFKMYLDGMTISQIAKNRDLTPYTIENHIITKFSERPEYINEEAIGLTLTVKEELKKAVEQVGTEKLKPIKDLVNPKISYFQIRTFLISY